MRPFTKLFLLALVLGLGFPVGSQAQSIGNCTLGTASQDLDINNVRARLFNKGNLFYNGGTPLYEVPVGSGISPIFAGGIWIGGTVNGQVRTAAATYAQFGEDYEFFPGPLNDDGSLPNPDDCSQFDRMYKVGAGDIAVYRATGNATPDLNDWPVGLGAPTCVDENEDGRCAPSEPRVEVTSRDQIIDLGAGQIPDIKGDQGIWWVMNDVGGTHKTTLSPPIGMEVQVLAFAFARADALGDATFYQYTFEYKGSAPLENTFLTIFSDPDLGNYEDDYIGSDPETGLGFVYNADNDDQASAGGYGIGPPALGYDFFVGPVTDVDGDSDLDTLSMTKFGYYNNDGDPRSGNPDTFDDFYNYMRGLWKDGTPWTEGGNALNEGGVPVDFVYPNSGSQTNPTPGYWSEVCPQPDCAEPIDPNDRRFIMSTGPFTMQPGDVQIVTYGVVWAQGADNFGSLQAIKTADILAQRAFDLEFQLAPPPPAPNVEVAVLSGQAAIEWSYPSSGNPANTNYLGGYDQVDPLIGGLPGIVDSTYTFEGFNIYSYPTPSFNDADRTLVATYDKANGITTIIDEAFDPELNAFVPFVAVRGTDNGLQFHHIIEEPLINYQDYFYGVTAYAYNEESTPDVIESQAATVTIRPADIAAANAGSIANADIGEGIAIEQRVGGVGTAGIAVNVVDPTQITGAEYRVEIINLSEDMFSDDSLTYRIINVDTGEVEFDGVAEADRGVLVRPGLESVVVDGISFFAVNPVDPTTLPAVDTDGVPDFAGNGAGIVEVARPDEDPCAGATSDLGCAFYGGNTVWLDPNSTGDYVITNPDNDIAALAGNIATAAPEDFEMRFTEACAQSGACLGVYASAAPGGNDLITSVPFELWNVGGRAEFTDDDIRMIPVLRALDDVEPTAEWADSFPASQEVVAGEDTLTLDVTQRVLWMMPDRPNGYELFAEAATGFGGPGDFYDPEADGDTQVDIHTDPDTGEQSECRRQNYYVDFCYRGGSTLFVAPVTGLDGMMLADLAGDGTTPPPGTTIRLLTVPNRDVGGGDTFVLDTESAAFVTQDDSTAQAAVEEITVVPNPYRGFSIYERDNFDRRVRFVNLPDAATIRIFTVSGTLIRTLQANNTRSFDWNLETENGLPVASGMYIIHVDTPAGEKVLKLGVVNRADRFDVF